MGNPFTSTVTRRLKQRFRISRTSRQMKETLISGKNFLSLTCCTVHTSRRLGYIVPAIGGLNPGNSGLEDNVPRRMDRYISSLLLAAIAAPTAIIADPRPQDAGSRSESTIGTTVIIITGPITRTAPTGATWKHSSGVIFGALGGMLGLAMKIR